MDIKKLPPSERPREKLLKGGAEALSNAELLALFIGSGNKSGSALELAQGALQHFSSLRHLLAASPGEFVRVPGLGKARYALLQAALEIGHRHLEERLFKEDVMEHPENVKSYLKCRLRHCQREVFAVLFLNNRHHVLSFEKLFFGTIDGATVHPREVVKRCLQHNAAAVILAHNHPSGIAEPSDADFEITRRLKWALELIDTRVLDHCIVGDPEVFSMAEEGHC